MELRNKKLGATFANKHTRLFVNESMAKKAKFSSRPLEMEIEPRVPGHIIGEITLTGEWIERRK